MEQTSISYGVVQHEISGDLWALKFVGDTICGVRKLVDVYDNTVGKSDLLGMTYDVGDDLEYVLQQRGRFAIYPWIKPD